jgi:hypothetical protein
MPLLLVVAALLGAACTCDTVQTSIQHPDGGPVRCVLSEDCPRTGTDNVCITDSPPDFTSTCVSCVATECVRLAVSCP